MGKNFQEWESVKFPAREKSQNHETKEKSDEVGGFIGFFFGQTYTDVMCYGTYSNANSAFLRLSSMACRLPL